MPRSIEQWKQYYAKNREQYLNNAARKRKELWAWFYEIKNSKKCIKCGESDIACLDFHHRNPKDKKFEVNVSSFKTYSKIAILAEIEKCDVLCSNCHRKLHYYENKR